MLDTTPDATIINASPGAALPRTTSSRDGRRVVRRAKVAFALTTA